MQSGLVPPDEASSAAGSGALKDYVAKQRRTDDERIRARSRADTRTAGGKIDWQSFKDKLVFISPDAHVDNTMAWKACDCLSLRVVEAHSRADVFIVREYRGRGLSKWLMECITSLPELEGLRRWVLVTSDAHSLYERVGFKPLSEPERYMERRRPNPYGTVS